MCPYTSVVTFVYLCLYLQPYLCLHLYQYPCPYLCLYLYHLAQLEKIRGALAQLTLNLQRPAQKLLGTCSYNRARNDVLVYMEV